MNQTTTPPTPLSPVSSSEVGRLLASDPMAAEARTREILKAQPENADALVVLAAALRRQGRAAEAKAILEPIAVSQPDQVFAQAELGLSLGLLGERGEALAAFARAVDLAPTYINAWCALADELALQRPAADANAPSMVAVFAAVDAAIAGKKLAEAEALLARALESPVDVETVRLRYAVVLLAGEKVHLALPVIEDLIRRDPANVFYRELRASALHERGDFHEAIAQYNEILSDGSERPGAWMSYGRALRSIGRGEESTAAFRKAVEILPSFAQGWRTLATIKTLRLEPSTSAHLQNLLARPGLLTSTRMQLHFALAKAFEDEERYGEAFEHYAKSQALQGIGVSGTAERFKNFARRLKAVFTPEFIRSRGSAGWDEAGPIFAVGMPRAGSTLVQEILAAHSMIERTGELHDLNRIVSGLRGEVLRPGAPTFPELVRSLAPERFHAIGTEYLESTRPRRKTGKPLFVDKHPENFVNVGLIHMILPRAKIIDVRRNPVDCCFSVFRNYFPSSPPWSHDLEEIGRFYVAYVEMMAHWDDVLPGRVHRVLYEELVTDPEKEVRRMLEYLEVPFEQSCLRFYEREQAITTTSVEQAREPIYASGVGNSGKFDPWLGALKKSLGNVLDAYPSVPKFDAPLKMSFSMRLA